MTCINNKYRTASINTILQPEPCVFTVGTRVVFPEHLRLWALDTPTKLAVMLLSRWRSAPQKTAGGGGPW